MKTDESMEEKKSKRKSFPEIIQNFTPAWFSVNMGTGILSILLKSFPYQFHGLHTIAVVLFVYNVVLFCIFILMTLARYIFYPHLLKRMLKHSSQSLFVGTLPMGLTTIVNFTILVLIDDYPWGRNLAFVLWCIDFALSICSAFIVPFFIVVHHDHQLKTLNGTLLLPVIPTVVNSASGGLLAQHLDETRGLVVLMMSYMEMGMGILLALIIIVIYFCRITIHSLPPREAIISTFLPLGPLGQGCYGMIQLGLAGKKIFADHYVEGLGTVAFGVGFILSFFLWGLAVWFFIMAIVSVTYTSRQRIPFNMGWWALTFPLGVFTTGTLSIGTILDSRFFLVLASILTCALVLIWLTVTFKTIEGVITGAAFNAPPPVTNSK
ncbi:voltage-dependent anion channel [Cokeromyces recurvatus]|uniref:voltage-dependent anion channel n=1 Tax=Cokeromyces recurvatus TaxID=90255 RepID=UPI00221FE17E|nr:voltage-dependent anion channel [Cokeromyces recurvatus]KAI7906383.1 voltage-dependent anion channel [Cokeromyces recurvatus]